MKDAFQTGLLAITKGDGKGVFRKGFKKLQGKKDSKKNLPMINEGRLTLAGGPGATIKKSQTIRGAPPTLSKKMADLVGRS